MIPLTAEEISILVKARDLLGEKAIQPEPYAGICDAVHNSIFMILKNSHVAMPYNPATQGNSAESRIDGTVTST